MKTVSMLRRELERRIARWRKDEEFTPDEAWRRAKLDALAIAWRERWKEEPHD